MPVRPRRAWSRSELALLRRQYANTPSAAIAAQLGRSVAQVYNRAGQLGLKKSHACIVAMSSRARLWSPAADRILKFAYADVPTSTLAGAFGLKLFTVYQRANKLGLRKSRECVAAMARQNTLALQAAGVIPRYPKGHVPANKGLRRPGYAPGRMAETQFKKGRPACESRNYVPIGTQKLCKDGYLVRKITDDPKLFPARRWEAVHRLVWAAAHGPIPKGMRVGFKPGMRTNIEHEITVDRLALVSAAEMMRRNTVHRLPPDLKAAHYAVGILKATITKKRKKLAAARAA